MGDLIIGVVLFVIAIKYFPLVAGLFVIAVVIGILHAIYVKPPPQKTKDLTLQVEIHEKPRKEKSTSTYDQHMSQNLIGHLRGRVSKAPTKGLVIRKDALQRILSGRKTLELRGRHHRSLGPMALIQKMSGHMYGVAEIVESIGPMTRKELCDRQTEHCVEDSRIDDIIRQGWVYGWRLENVVTLKRPVPYVHKGMSQVKLDENAITEIQKQLGSARA